MLESDIKELVSAGAAADRDRARAVFAELRDALSAMGLLEEVYRLPMVSPRAESKEKINAVLKDLGLLKAALV